MMRRAVLFSLATLLIGCGESSDPTGSTAAGGSGTGGDAGMPHTGDGGEGGQGGGSGSSAAGGTGGQAGTGGAAGTTPSCDPNLGSWTVLDASDGPEPRPAAGVWTGASVLLSGGALVDSFNQGALIEFFDGATYSIDSDRWSPIADAPFSFTRGTEAWTESALVVWDGCDNGGPAAYLPDRNEWAELSQVDRPPPCSGSIVAAGTKAIVFAGPDSAIYDPIADTWRRLSATGAPSARTGALLAWTGTELIVWGGYDATADEYAQSGAVYRLEDDTWRPISTEGMPTARQTSSTRPMWTGEELIVWGGLNDQQWVDTGARYDPALDDWEKFVVAPYERLSAVWTGDRVLVVGGGDVTAVFDPATGETTPVVTCDAPEFVSADVVVWTGEMLWMWGRGPGHPIVATFRPGPALP